MQFDPAWLNNQNQHIGPDSFAIVVGSRSAQQPKQPLGSGTLLRT